MKILILKPSSLGDIIQALPVLRLLKAHLPDSEIYWWIETAFAPLLEGDPDLAGVVPFDRHRWASPRYWPEAWGSVRQVRGQAFDWVIDLQCLARSALFAWFANGEFTLGLDEPREGARGFYDRIVPRPSYHTHAVDWYLGVLPVLGVPVHRNFEWLPRRENVRQKWPIDKPFIVLQPGARWINKRWPVEHFSALNRLISDDLPLYRVVVLGSAAETPLGQLISRSAPERCLDLTGQLSLPEMVECLRASELMVTNDTGPMHVAAALRKPLIPLFGPTEPRRTGPYGQVERAMQWQLPCVPCMSPRCTYFKPFECLKAISPGLVFEAVKKRLSEGTVATRANGHVPAAEAGFGACHTQAPA